MSFITDAIGNYMSMGDQQKVIQDKINGITDPQQKMQLQDMLAQLSAAQGNGFMDYMGGQTMDHLRGKIGLDPNNPLPPSMTGMYTPQQMMASGPKMLTPAMPKEIGGSLLVPKGTESLKDKIGKGLLQMIGLG